MTYIPVNFDRDGLGFVAEVVNDAAEALARDGRSMDAAQVRGVAEALAAAAGTLLVAWQDYAA